MDKALTRLADLLEEALELVASARAEQTLPEVARLCREAAKVAEAAKPPAPRG